MAKIKSKIENDVNEVILQLPDEDCELTADNEPNIPETHFIRGRFFRGEVEIILVSKL